MAKSGQYRPHRSQPLHFSAATTWGGWYPLELNAEESESTRVGQNSTQKPQPLQRSIVMNTEPLAIWATACTPMATQKRPSGRQTILSRWQHGADVVPCD